MAKLKTYYAVVHTSNVCDLSLWQDENKAREEAKRLLLENYKSYGECTEEDWVNNVWEDEGIYVTEVRVGD